MKPIRRIQTLLSCNFGKFGSCILMAPVFWFASQYCGHLKYHAGSPNHVPSHILRLLTVVILITLELREVFFSILSVMLTIDRIAQHTSFLKRADGYCTFSINRVLTYSKALNYGSQSSSTPSK